ncbi:heavy-metal-associated domain-containing protein [Clostridium oryzae]|uniref:Uncharacterized protein n=1 Tax=Clostridium oryzae TaxID=1450648 RepID=A0A1V4II66_9CLOT|nr:heavy-metal-associated domain-containing protein [Clostridium oryzae]OPJ59643.1 hypothetical protein CLORY_31870 [Clostridium oryzae]
MNRIRLNIEGLQENETQDKVRKQLENLSGIQDVFLSKGQTYVDINYDDRTSIEEINSHLQNNGYKIMNKE